MRQAEPGGGGGHTPGTGRTGWTEANEGLAIPDGLLTAVGGEEKGEGRGDMRRGKFRNLKIKYESLFTVLGREKGGKTGT